MYRALGRFPKYCREDSKPCILGCSSKSTFAGFSFKDEAEFKECYKTLGLKEGCCQEEVKLAFIGLAKQYHPDVISRCKLNDASHFVKVEAAYRKLQEKFEVEKKLAEQSGENNKPNFQQEIDDQGENPNDDYIAPQHRQYLNYGGIGHGTPFDREKQHKKYQVKKAVEHVYNHRISQIQNIDEHSLVFKEAKAIKKIKTQYGIDRMVEDLIQESMAKGEFSNLKGSGKPLCYQNHNPFVDIVTQKINQVLIDNGFSPQWVMLEKEIRVELTTLKERLKEQRVKLGRAPLNFSEAEQWTSFLKLLADDVKVINKKINDYNLIVPLLNKQMVHVNLSRLAERCLAEQCSKLDVVNSSSKGSSADKAIAAHNSNADTQHSFLGYLACLWR